MTSVSTAVRTALRGWCVLLLTAAPAWAQADLTVAFPTAPLFENGTNVYVVTIANDPDANAVLTVAGSNAELAPAEALTILGTGANRLVVYRPPYDRSGTTDLTFSLRDPDLVEQVTQAGLQVVAAVAVPRAPSEVDATETSGQAVFSWTGAAPALQSDLPSYYVLEIGDAPGLTAFAPIRLPARLDGASLNLPRGGYTFRLRPGNRLGLGTVSAEGSLGLPTGANVPGPPAGFAVDLSPSNVATARWAPSTFGAAPLFYMVEVGTAEGLSDIGRFPVPAGFSSVSGTLGAGRYFLRIRGVSAGGEGPASPEVVLTGPSGACGAPTAPVLSPILRSGSTVLVAWKAPPTGRVEGYRVSVGSTPGATDLASLVVGPSTSYFQGAPGAGTYHLFVQALCGGAASPSSSVVSYTEPPVAAPGAPRRLVGTAGAGSATLSWAPPVSGGRAVSYVLEAGFAPGDASIVVPLASNAPGISFAGVPAGTYHVRVRAENGAGRSAVSNEIVLTVP